MDVITLSTRCTREVRTRNWDGCGEFRCPFRFVMLWVASNQSMRPENWAFNFPNHGDLLRFRGPKTGPCAFLCNRVQKTDRSISQITVTFCDLGVPKQDHVKKCVSCVSGHFLGPKYFQTSKFSGIGASSKVVLHESVTHARTHRRTAILDKSEYEEAPLASFRS